MAVSRDASCSVISKESHAMRHQAAYRKRWHPEQVSTLLPNGSYQLDVPYGEDWDLIQDILKQGVDVEVIGPAGLREKVGLLTREMARIYGGK